MTKEADLLTVMLKRKFSTGTILKISLIIDREKKTGGEMAATRKRRNIQAMIENCGTEEELVQLLQDI